MKNCASSWLKGLAWFVALLGVSSRDHAADFPVTYVVLAEQGGIARAIIQRGIQCPKGQIDNKDVQISKWSNPDEARFPVVVCEFKIPDGAKNVTVGGAKLPWPPRLEKIIALGDTGCDIRSGQRCDDPISWPFSKIAKNAAASKPTLVIHVGDYMYRHLERVQSRACSDSCDTWQAWKEDFFEPAAPLLIAAPWIMARGDNEGCAWDGAHDGFFLFLSTTHLQSGCVRHADPFFLSVEKQEFLILDSGDEKKEVPLNEKEAMRPRLEGTWIIRHVPFNDADLEDAHNAGKISLILAGHAHHWDVDKSHQTLQIGVGMGGALLDHERTYTVVYGFAVFERMSEPANWKVTFEPVPKSCQILGRKADLRTCQ